MQSLSSSYREYLELSKHNNGLMIESDVNTMIGKLVNTSNLSSNYAPVVFLSDYTLGKYIYVDESCFSVLGFTAKYFMESGVDSYLSKWHPVDFDIFNRKIFPTNISFLKNLPFKKYNDIVFSYNYRILNSDGVYLTMLQRFSFIPGNIMGEPLGILGVIIDITHFKTEETVIHTIEEISTHNYEKTTAALFKKVYYPNEKLLALSKREIEVLKLMGKGFSSKQIADQLTISTYTVNNHRKNMLRKTTCANSSDLLNTSIRHGLI
jgi:DNA-binding CsgD family transcriptional regulator